MNEAAAQLLKNPAWQAAWDALRTEMLDTMEMAAPHDTSVLSEVAHRLWALREVRAELERLMVQETAPDAN
jgi:hypothetical protein